MWMVYALLSFHSSNKCYAIPWVGSFALLKVPCAHTLCAKPSTAHWQECVFENTLVFRSPNICCKLLPCSITCFFACWCSSTMCHFVPPHFIMPAYMMATIAWLALGPCHFWPFLTQPKGLMLAPWYKKWNLEFFLNMPWFPRLWRLGDAKFMCFCFAPGFESLTWVPLTNLMGTPSSLASLLVAQSTIVM